MIRRLIAAAVRQHDEQHPPVGRLGYALTVLAAGAAITWGIGKMTHVADELRAELEQLADARRIALAELAELRDDISEEQLARYAANAAGELDDDQGDEPAGDQGDELPALCTARAPWGAGCVQDAGHRGAHRGADERVWRRLKTPASCEELSPGDRWTCRGVAGHDGPHAAGEYTWTSEPLPRQWVHNPDDWDQLDPAGEQLPEAVSAS